MESQGSHGESSDQPEISSREGSAPREQGQGSAPREEGQQLVPVKVEEGDCDSPGGAAGAVASALGEIKNLDPDNIIVSWHKSRSSICVRVMGRRKSFLAPSFQRSCARGDFKTPLGTAVESATLWVQGHKGQALEGAEAAPLAGPSAAQEL